MEETSITWRVYYFLKLIQDLIGFGTDSYGIIKFLRIKSYEICNKQCTSPTVLSRYFMRIIMVMEVVNRHVSFKKIDRKLFQ